MSENDNLKTVEEIFGAFGRGDVAGVLALLADDVRWTVSGPAEVPHFGERRGHEQVREFFVSLGTNVEFERFETDEFVCQGEKVVVLGGERGRVRRTGRSFDNDWAMVFTLTGGKVSNFRAYENTAAVAEAFRGE